MTDPNDALIEEVLNFDAFNTCDQNGIGGMASLGFFVASNKIKEAVLRDAGDTPFHCELNEHLAMAIAEGFEVVLVDKFTGRSSRDEIRPEESFIILWNPEGFLMTLESYYGTGRNMAKLYYNLDLSEIMANEERKYYRVTSSGGFIYDKNAPKDEDGYSPRTDLWAGDHDAREGFRHTLRKLRSAKPLPVWVKRPHLWLINYGETPDHAGGVRPDYDAITEERISRLPQNVQDAIKGDPKYD